MKDDIDSLSMMQVFRFPYVSYLTSTTFSEFTKGMNECISILVNSTSNKETEEIELKSVEDFLLVLNSNFEALGYCSVDLSSLFADKIHYETFMEVF